MISLPVQYKKKEKKRRKSIKVTEMDCQDSSTIQVELDLQVLFSSERPNTYTSSLKGVSID